MYYHPLRGKLRRKLRHELGHKFCKQLNGKSQRKGIIVWKLVIFALTLFLLAGCAQITSPVAARHKTISVIPVPVSAHFTNRGTFTITAETTIGYSANVKDKAEQLAGMLRPATGFALKVEPSSAKNNSIRLVMEEASRIPLEGYELSIDRDSIHVTASSQAGLFYGCQSLLQLLPVDIYKKTKAKDINWTVQAMEIRDYPRFGWRGAMLDVARHYMPKEFIFKLIDTLAMHKMNSLQLHLTDDQGWRIEIKKYPKLTETGAWRKETLLGHYRDKPHKYDGKKHGGFYTQDDIREIVEYAKQRHVNIVPEIEMPGHTQAAIASYPHLGNTKEKLPVRILWGVNPNIVNPNESTILFFQDVLTEVMELFPSKFIHIGGDEAPKDQWKASADAQKRIKDLGLKDEHELQSYFIKRMDKFLASKGRRLIGWDEILEGGLAPGATVMSWRGEAGGIKAAQMGHDVVMAPTTYTYFDYYQSRDKNQPLAIGGFLPLEKVYGYDPVTKALTEEQAKHVLGTQGQLWTEYISTPQKAEYMGFPRLTALAEVAWTPRGKKDYADFIKSTIPADVDFSGIKLVLDCANGAAYKIAPRIFRELGAVIHDQVRLKLARHGRHLRALPGLGGPQRPGHVIPQYVDLPVVAHQFPHAAVGEVHEAAARLLAVGALRPVRMMPVHQGVVKADLEPELAAGLHVLPHQVAAGTSPGGVVGGLLGVPQQEALVMLGGHNHVLHPGLPGQAGPVARATGLGLPGAGQLLVLLDGDALPVHDPLVAFKLGVEPPVHEHAEARVVPPFHATGALPRSRGRLLSLRHC